MTQARPIKEYYTSRYEVDDIFFDQFVYNITGQSKYSCEFMTEALSLELAFIAIRTLGVYFENERRKFE